jgi:hypothetical protein
VVGFGRSYCHSRVAGGETASPVEISAEDVSEMGKKLAKLVKVVELID